MTELTKEQVQFARRALESVVFRYTSGNCTLELRDKAKAELQIACKFDFRSYADNPVNCTSAFATIHTPSYTPEWLTIVSLLRAGDAIALEFLADGHSNQYAKVAHGKIEDTNSSYERLHVDALRLHILRKDKKGNLQRALSFNVTQSICPNNTARMIQFAWRQ